MANGPRSNALRSARPPRNLPIGVRAPATMTEAVTADSCCIERDGTSSLAAGPPSGGPCDGGVQMRPRFGVTIIPSASPRSDPVGEAVLAEQLGFDLVSVWDHPHGDNPSF